MEYPHSTSYFENRRVSLNNLKSVKRFRAKRKGWISISAQYQKSFSSVTEMSVNGSRWKTVSKPISAQEKVGELSNLNDLYSQRKQR